MLDRTTQSRWLLAVLVVCALIAGACSGGDASDDGSDTAPNDESSADVGADDSAESLDDADTGTDDAEVPDEPKYDLDYLDELTRWAAEFTGGPGGETSGDSVRIGYVHDAELAPQHLPVAEAAVRYINEELGGIAGRSLELVPCDPSVPRIELEVDPESDDDVEVEVEIPCHVDFAENDDLVAVVSQTRIDNTTLYDALADVRPVLVAQPGDVAELTTSTTTTYLAGTLVTGGMGIWALSLELESAVALFTDNVGGRDGFTMLEPMFAAAGVDLVPVWVTPTTSASRVESSLVAAAASEADLLILALDEPGCIAATEALTRLEVDGTANIIISTSTCLSPVVQAALTEAGVAAGIPSNWHFGTNGFNPFDPTIESGHATIAAVLEGPLLSEQTGDSGVEATIVAMLAIAQVLNRADGDYSHDTVLESLRSPRGPVPTQAGEQQCDRSPEFEPVCAGHVGVIQFAGGSWIDVATGDAAIDLGQILFPPG